MRIIKEGTFPKQFRFECAVCGCVFEATRDECDCIPGGVTLSHICPCCNVNITIVINSDMCDQSEEHNENNAVKQNNSKEDEVPSADCDFPISTSRMKIMASAKSGACFHGECWYRCPHCNSSFEGHALNNFQRSIHNEDVIFCPRCGYGFVL